jgi:hypothetical protein
LAGVGLMPMFVPPPKRARMLRRGFNAWIGGNQPQADKNGTEIRVRT